MRGAAWASLWCVVCPLVLRRCRRSAALCLGNMGLAVTAALAWATLHEGLDIPGFALAFLVRGGKTRLLILLFWAICLLLSALFVVFAHIHKVFLHLTPSHTLGAISADG